MNSKMTSMAAAMAMSMALVIAPVTPAQADLRSQEPWGDINQDGNLDAADALAVFHLILDYPNAPTVDTLDSVSTLPTCGEGELLNPATNVCVTIPTCGEGELLNTATNECVTPPTCPGG